MNQGVLEARRGREDGGGEGIDLWVLFQILCPSWDDHPGMIEADWPAFAFVAKPLGPKLLRNSRTKSKPQ